MKFSIRLLYLYLFSFIGLIIVVIGTIQLINLGIKVYIFKGADVYQNYRTPAKFTPDGKEVALTNKEEEEQNRLQDTETKRSRQRQVSNSIAMLLVGLPLYVYHWSKIQKENKK